MALANFNATTPQSKLIKNVIEGYFSGDMNNLEPLVSKDYKFETFPKVNALPDEEKGGHLERYGALFSLMTKVEVCIHTAFKFVG